MSIMNIQILAVRIGPTYKEINPVPEAALTGFSDCGP